MCGVYGGEGGGGREERAVICSSAMLPQQDISFENFFLLTDLFLHYLIFIVYDIVKHNITE